MLIRLLIEPGVLVSTDALVDTVWEERAPTDAAKNVQIYVALNAEGASRWAAGVACQRLLRPTRRTRVLPLARSASDPRWSARRGRLVAAGQLDLALARFPLMLSRCGGGRYSPTSTVRHVRTGADRLLRSSSETPPARTRSDFACSVGRAQNCCLSSSGWCDAGRCGERRWGHLMVAYYQAARQVGGASCVREDAAHVRRGDGSRSVAGDDGRWSSGSSSTTRRSSRPGAATMAHSPLPAPLDAGVECGRLRGHRR